MMNLLTKAYLNLYQHYKRKQAKRHELTHLYWECTLRCNFNCLHCGNRCLRRSDVPDMPADHFLSLLSEIAPHLNSNKTRITLIGGEPLMRKDLEECGQAISEMGFSWGMITNGWELTPQRLNGLIDAGLRSLTISLDGYSDATHEWFHGKKGSWLKALNAISYAAAHPNLILDVETSVNRRNITELEHLKKLLITLDVRRWRLTTLLPREKTKDEPMLRLSQDAFVQLLDFIARTRKEGEIRAFYGCGGYLGDYELKVRDTPFFCQAGIHTGSLLVNGDISACPGLRGHYVQGNIYKEEFMEVWNNRFQLMRNRSWTRTDRCSDCHSFSYCQGNGLHLRDDNRGELLQCYPEMTDR